MACTSPAGQARTAGAHAGTRWRRCADEGVAVNARLPGVDSEGGTRAGPLPGRIASQGRVWPSQDGRGGSPGTVVRVMRRRGCQAPRRGEATEIASTAAVVRSAKAESPTVRAITTPRTPVGRPGNFSRSS